MFCLSLLTWSGQATHASRGQPPRSNVPSLNEIRKLIFIPNCIVVKAPYSTVMQGCVVLICIDLCCRIQHLHQQKNVFVDLASHAAHNEGLLSPAVEVAQAAAASAAQTKKQFELQTVVRALHKVFSKQLLQIQFKGDIKTKTLKVKVCLSLYHLYNMQFCSPEMFIRYPLFQSCALAVLQDACAPSPPKGSCA